MKRIIMLCACICIVGCGKVENESSDKLVSSVQTSEMTDENENTFENIQKKASNGDAEAQYYMGVYYFNNNLEQQNYDLAIDYFQKAAEQQNALAQYAMGYMYFGGYGVEQDWKATEEWMEKSATNENQKCLPAAEFLAMYYANPNFSVRNPDYNLSDQWFNFIKDNFSQYDDIKFDHSYVYYKLGDYTKMCSIIKDLSNEGMPYAQYVLSLMYYYGFSDIEQNSEEEMKLTAKILNEANEGDEIAQHLLDQHFKGIISGDMDTDEKIDIAFSQIYEHSQMQFWANELHFFEVELENDK